MPASPRLQRRALQTPGEGGLPSKVYEQECAEAAEKVPLRPPFPPVLNPAGTSGEFLSAIGRATAEAPVSDKEQFFAKRA
jgi:hypothetical protein